MTNPVDLLSRPINFAVVQLAERQFPGVVVQGDTLHGLVRQFDEMVRLLEAGQLDDLAAEIEDVKDQLSEGLTHFEQVCAERHISLPYAAS